MKNTNNQPNGEKIVKLLIELYAAQNNVQAVITEKKPTNNKLVG